MPKRPNIRDERVAMIAKLCAKWRAERGLRATQLANEANGHSAANLAPTTGQSGTSHMGPMHPDIVNRRMENYAEFHELQRKRRLARTVEKFTTESGRNNLCMEAVPFTLAHHLDPALTDERLHFVAELLVPSEPKASNDDWIAVMATAIKCCPIPSPVRVHPSTRLELNILRNSLRTLLAKLDPRYHPVSDC